MRAMLKRQGFPLAGQPVAQPIGARPRGFTLVELMVTLAVLVVVTAFAIPSFKNITLSNRLSTAADGIVAAIQTARMEAIKRNADAQFCSDSSSNNGTSTLGSACASNAGGVYAGTAASKVRDAITGIDTPLKFNGSMVALRFSAQGQGYKVGDTAPYTGTVADICTASLSSGNHRVISLAAGSVITTTTTSTSCP